MGEAMLPLPLSLGECLPGTERGRPERVSCSDFEADSEGNLWRAHLVLPAEPPFAFAQNPTEGVPETPPGASHAGRGSRFGEQQGYREPD